MWCALPFKLTKEENRKLSVDSLSRMQTVKRQEGKDRHPTEASSRKSRHSNSKGIGLLLECLDFDWSVIQAGIPQHLPDLPVPFESQHEGSSLGLCKVTACVWTCQNYPLDLGRACPVGTFPTCQPSCWECAGLSLACTNTLT